MNYGRILIIGANGQLGTALKQQYPEAKAADINELDITDKEPVEHYNWSDIDIILNAAAYTNVDGAETPEGRVAAWKVNAVAVGYLAKAAAKHDLTLMHISTDYVFDGTQNPHTEDEPLSPLSTYGSAKAAGDIAAQLAEKVYILRTTMVIGTGNNFVRAVLNKARSGGNLNGIVDQIGRLTFTTELVRAIDHLLSRQSPYGIYNVSNDGDATTWAEVMRVIIKEAGLTNTVDDVSTEEYFKGKQAATRPLLQAYDLSKIKATGFTPRDWREDLHDYIQKEITPGDQS